jgi:hypothetical protein
MLYFPSWTDHAHVVGASLAAILRSGRQYSASHLGDRDRDVCWSGEAKHVEASTWPPPTRHHPGTIGQWPSRSTFIGPEGNPISEEATIPREPPSGDT